MPREPKRPAVHPAERLPADATLDEVGDAASACRACDLWSNATQTVFGAGATRAAVMFVGEQPGNQEDRAGQPFVGPAGRVLQEAIAEAGLKMGRVYLTNAVKHFKWTPRGKRRIHAKPRLSEVLACRPWLATELAKVKPRAVVCLGATAARAVLGRAVTIGDVRGRALVSPLAPLVFVTMHPSAILRSPDAAARAAARQAFVDDLKKVAEALR